MNEVLDASEIKRKRMALHAAMKEKIKGLCAEAAKLGYRNCFSANLPGIGLAEAKDDDQYIYLRVGQKYYVSTFDIPPAEVLVEGVKVLKALIEAFNALVLANAAQLDGAERTLKELQVATVPERK